MLKYIPLLFLGFTSLHGSNFYAEFQGGVNFVQNTNRDGNRASYDTGYILDGFVGYQWQYGLALEFEYAYRRNDLRRIDFVQEGFSTQGHFQNTSLMGNLVWTGCPIWNILPSVGAGLGYDYQKMHAINTRVLFNQKWNHFSWQLMAGLSYPIFCNAEVTLDYTFHSGGHHFYNHSVGLGLLYNFGFL